MSSRSFPRRLTWCQWVVTDPYNHERYTTFYASVYAPTWERLYPSILLRITSGTGSAFFRASSVEALQRIIVIPTEYVGRLESAIVEAIRLADGIERDMRLAMERRKLPQGAGLARTDTGEIVAEAERIVQRQQSEGKRD